MKDLQLESIDDDLRNRLWNVVTTTYWDQFQNVASYGDVKRSNLEHIIVKLWHGFFKYPLDKMESAFYKVRPVFRDRYFEFEWYQVYDFIEFLYSNSYSQYSNNLESACNVIFEEENAGYRMIGGKVTPITSKTEVEEVEGALSASEPFVGVRTHLEDAIAKLSNREKSDYRNSVKESISAVESLCQVVTGDRKATLGQALNALEKHMPLHGAFKAGLSSLYGYTSDEGGIRHALLEEDAVTFSDAKFMLVTCSGFVNYVIGKIAEHKISIPVGT